MLSSFLSVNDGGELFTNRAPPIRSRLKPCFSSITSGVSPIARGRFDRTPPVKDKHRINENIRIPQVRLIGAEGENVGVIDTNRALDMAIEAKLDLVEISPGAEPPVCKIMDYGKFKFLEQKKKKEAKKNQKIVETKEIKMRPGIDEHDYQTKMKAVGSFLEKGDKVKFTIRFRGRELAHQEKGMDVLTRVRDELGEDNVKVEAQPKMEGRQMIMVVAPK